MPRLSHRMSASALKIVGGPSVKQTAWRKIGISWLSGGPVAYQSAETGTSSLPSAIQTLMIRLLRSSPSAIQIGTGDPRYSARPTIRPLSEARRVRSSPVGSSATRTV